MYKPRKAHISLLKGKETLEGERLETKVERIMCNNEPIKDGAPIIYTERKDGVISAYNIRTDRWEIACDAMTAVTKSLLAQRENKAEKTKVIQLENNEVKPIQGTDGGL